MHGLERGWKGTAILCGVVLGVAATHHAALCAAVADGKEHAATDGEDEQPAVVVQSGDRAMARAVTRTETPPVIDGVLDDEVWERATIITDFFQVEPDEGALPTERTEVRLLYDRDRLYIGVRCYDSRPDDIVASQMQRDANITTDDHITLILDPFDRARSGYEFQISAAGGMRDGILETDAETNYDWRGFWDARVTRDEHGWTAEIAIPFTTISFDPRAEKWGFNIERWIPRVNERMRWSSPLRNTSVRRLSAAGALTGLEDLHQGLGITVKPFARLDYDFVDDSMQFKPGLDVFYNITPTTTLALTVNTDFAETEVDDRVVNLTRFPVFFPEKRDFFLQDAGVFEFGGITRSPLPFFSRRIGLVRGEEKDILAGARLTGRQGPVRFGLMNVQMKDDDELGSKNLTVARAAVDVLEESSVGFIATHGDPSTPGDNTLGGLDFNFLQRDRATGDRITANAWIMGTYTDPDNSDRSNSDPLAVGMRLGMPNEPVRWHLGYQFIGADFNPAMGFVQRRDRRVYDGELVYRWRPADPGHFVRFLDIGVDTEVWTFSDNEIEQARVNIPNIEMATRTNELYYIKTYYDHEKLVRPFEIVEDVFVPTGTYDTYGVYGGFRTSTSKPVAFRFEGGYRSFYTGHRLDALFRVRLRPSRHFFGGFDYERNAVDLGDDRFTVHILRGQADFLFTPQLGWNNIVQWDSQSKNLTFNSRVRWEFRPGQELFIVYNEGLLTDGGSFTTENRQATIKIGASFRF